MPLQRRKAVRNLHLGLTGHGLPRVLPYVPYTPPVFPAFSKHNPEMDLLKAEGLFFRPSEGSLPPQMNALTRLRPNTLARGPALKLFTDIRILRIHSRPDSIRSPDLSKLAIHAGGKGPLNSHPVRANVEPLRVRPQAICHTSPPLDLSSLATPTDVLIVPAEAPNIQHATRNDFQALLATLPPRSIADDIARNEPRDIVEPKCGRTLKNVLIHARDSVFVEKQRRKAEQSSTNEGQSPRACVSTTIGRSPLSASTSISEMRINLDEELESEFDSAEYLSLIHISEPTRPY